MIINRDLIGHRFAECSFDNFEILSSTHRTALNACKALLSGDSSGVMLTGPVGRGKTHLLVALAYEFNREADLRLLDDKDCVLVEDPGNNVVFWPHIALSGSLKSGFNDGSYAINMEDCKTADLLIIDDLMSEGTGKDGKLSPFELNFTEEIIEYRYNQGSLIALSSNLEHGRLKEVYTPRIASRLTDMCRDIVMLDGDEDYRLKKHRERNG